MLKALQTAGLIVVAIPFSIPLAWAAIGWFVGTIQGANSVCDHLYPGHYGPSADSWAGGSFLLTAALMLLSIGDMYLALFLAYHAGSRSKKR